MPLRSLKIRVALTTVALLIASVWSLALYASRAMRTDIENLLGAQQLATVTVLAADTNSEFTLRRGALELAAQQITSALIQNPRALQQLLTQKTTLSLLFNAGVFVTGTDGVAIAEYPVLGRTGLNYLERDYVATALTQGRSSVGQPVLGKRVMAAVFAIGVPIHAANGSIIGTISGVIDLNRPNFLDELTDSNYGKTGGYLIVDPRSRQFVITTANNRRLAMQPIPKRGVNAVLDRRLEGFDGSAVNVNSLNIEVLTSSARIPEAGWLVIATLPTQEAFAPVRALLQRTAVATLLLTIAAGLSAWWLIKRQIAPVSSTIEVLAHYAEVEQHPAPPLLVQRRDEIGALVGAFNKLLSALDKRETALRQSEQRFHRFFENNSSVQLLIEPMSGVIQDANQSAAAYYGYPKAQLIGMNISAINVQPPDQLAEHRLRAAIEHQNYFQFQHRLASGAIRDVEVHTTPIVDGNQNLLLSIIHDITEQLFAQSQLRQNNQELQAILNSNIAGIVKLTERRFVWMNNAFAHMLGYDVAALTSQPTRVLYPNEDEYLQFADSAYTRLEQGKSYRTQIRFVRKGGEIGWFDISGEMLASDQRASIWCCVDITQLKAAEATVRTLAFHDPLTNLPNRRLLVDRLEQVIAAGKRSGKYAALIFLDLDNFKPLNDHYGHEFGDLLLIEAARRLVACVRSTDTVARFGGDEYVVMLSELPPEKSEATDQTLQITEKIRTALSVPYHLAIQHSEGRGAEVVHCCTASLGVTLFQNHPGTAGDLLHWADTAMYQAKQEGRNRVHFYQG